MHKERSQLDSFGCWVSEKVADTSAHPFTQLGVLLFCGAWFAFGLDVGILTAALSILAITLTQMVLNKQEVREADAHRRDVALHAKLDELLIASKRARDELAGIENLEEEEIEAVRNGQGNVAKLRLAHGKNETADKKGAVRV